jgi:hypothetical protein
LSRCASHDRRRRRGDRFVELEVEGLDVFLEPGEIRSGLAGERDRVAAIHRGVVEARRRRRLAGKRLRVGVDALFTTRRPATKIAESPLGGPRLRLLAELLLHAQEVPRVRAVLDLAANSRPVLLERVVTLDQHLHPETPRGVSDLGAAQDPEPAIDVFARDGGLDFLDAEKILLVERSQAVETILELVQRYVDLLRNH